MNQQSPSDIEVQIGKLKLRLNPRQFEVFDSPARFRVLVAGRRFGKSELAFAEILKVAQEANRLIWYICPTDGQGRRVVWDRLKSVTQKLWARKPRETDGRIDLANGSTIELLSAFNPRRLCGNGLDLVILDEVADLKSDAWPVVIRPALTDRRGRALFIGTPQGRNHLYDYFELAKTNPDWASFQFTTAQGGIVQPDELESAARDISANIFRTEFQAEFTTIGEYRAYLGFDRASNVRETHFEPSLPLIWSLDFNVDPMCMLVMQRHDDVVHVIEEIVVRSNSNTTEDACRLFIKQIEPYAKARARIYGALEIQLYGDASGHQRRTSAADTDWNIIRNHFRLFHTGSLQLSCHFAKVNPHVRDRVNCVNARLRNASQEPRLFLSPGCKELIRDLEEVCWATDSVGAATNQLNKSDKNRTHMSDALGYYISQAFPLRGTFNF